MGRIIASLKALWRVPAVWHFADDLLTPIAAGIPAILAAFTVPADGNWKLAIGGLVLAILGVVIPAVRRAVATDGPALIQLTTSQLSPILGVDMNLVYELTTLYNEVNAIDPALVVEIKAAIVAELAKLKVASVS